MIICGPLPAPLLGWRTVYFMLASIKVSTFKENVVHNFLLTTIKFDCFTLLRLHTDGMGWWVAVTAQCPLLCLRVTAAGWSPGGGQGL